MPTHTFIAENASAAVEQIRTQLGPEAVVLSVRKLPRSGLSRLLKKEQIEVVAMLEEEAEPARPNSLQELQAEIATLKNQFATLQTGRAPAPGSDPLSQILWNLGILPEFHQAIAGALRPGAGEDQVREVLRSMWRQAPPENPRAAQIFVGVPGCGKSTVLCKMLAQARLIEQQPAAVFQLDTHVANTSAQSAIFSEIVAAQHSRSLPTTAFRSGRAFVDLPGVALGDEKGLKALRAAIDSFAVSEVHLVVNGAYEAHHWLKQARFFAPLKISGIIVSHLDEESRWSKIWNLLLGTNFVVRYLSAGQNVPGDLHRANPDLAFRPKTGEISF